MCVLLFLSSIWFLTQVFTICHLYSHPCSRGSWHVLNDSGYPSERSFLWVFWTLSCVPALCVRSSPDVVFTWANRDESQVHKSVCVPLSALRLELKQWCCFHSVKFLWVPVLLPSCHTQYGSMTELKFVLFVSYFAAIAHLLASLSLVVWLEWTQNVAESSCHLCCLLRASARQSWQPAESGDGLWASSQVLDGWWACALNSLWG